jgi:nitronate monooxygenase
MLPFPNFQHPIVQAPMAGGPSTPALTAAVSSAGGFGFLAAGYKKVDAVRAELQRTRELTPRPFGLNLFVPSQPAPDAAAVQRYLQSLQPEAAVHGAALGTPRYEDDAWADKLTLAIEERVPVLSFTFGCPARDVIERLHGHDIAVWVTVTELQEAVVAAQAGADALVLQGVEAGGHRGTFTDEDGSGEVGVLSLLRLCARNLSLPLVAAGGIADGAGVAAVLAAGAAAAAIGSGFLRCPEAATSAPFRRALARAAEQPTRTALTRAFTGRRARGLVNRFLAEHSRYAPSAYPEIHYVTQPLRAAAVAAGDSEQINLWAGQAHALAEELPAAVLVERWATEARAALERAAERFARRPNA